eukprot:GHVU01007174.1.p1 GENE.GHVU01007174.1~~GHVU01007174.1.p1  ORF type:complete len:181 (+),score=8.18 GHVU01007174.1:275-817(+)
MRNSQLIAIVGLAALAFSFVEASTATGIRQLPCKRKRVQYEYDVGVLEFENEYKSVYRMQRRSFDRLVALLQHRLWQDPIKSRQRSGTDPVSPATKVSCAIRWLAGGKHHDIRRVYQMSKSHFYAVVYQVIRAINEADDLRLQFPRTQAERAATAAGFAAISPLGVINGCIGCIATGFTQ